MLAPNRLGDLDPLRSQTRGSSRSVSMILAVRASFPACFTHARHTPPTDLFCHHSPPITTWLGSDLMLVAMSTEHYFSSFSSDLRSHNTILLPAINRLLIMSVKMHLCSSCSCSHDLTGASAQQSQVNATALRDLNVQYHNLVRFAGSEKIVQSTR